MYSTLGVKLGQLEGRVTCQRVLPPDGPGPKMETTFEISGTVLETETTMIGTYWSTVRTDGSLYGECPWQGVIMTQDGEMGTWGGAGVGRFNGPGGAVSFRGAVYYQIASQKLARLNTVAVLYE